MKLNDRQIKNAKPAEKPYKLNDGKGLYLYVNTSGGKLWRFDFSHNGKRKTLSIGKYPTVSLVEARQTAENARRLLAAGQDPGEAKQQEKRERQAAVSNTLKSGRHTTERNISHSVKSLCNGIATICGSDTTKRKKNLQEMLPSRRE